VRKRVLFDQFLTPHMLACSWSGGKDGCFAFWKMACAGYEIKYLLNTYRKESGRVAFHGVRASLIEEQARSIGVELLQKEVAGNDYEKHFLEALFELKSLGVDGIVFGDIDIEQNRQWCESVCKKAGVRSYFPLWNLDQARILKDFIAEGFKAVVVALNSKFLNEEWLGKIIGLEFLNQIEAINVYRSATKITPCGEMGEYHTFVFDGPLFRFPIRYRLGEKVFKEGYWLIDLLQ